MPVDKSYLDHFYVRNLTSNTIGLGDLVNLNIPPHARIDLLTVPRINKEKINQSHDLQAAIRAGKLRIEKEKCRRKNKTKAEREATISDEERELCDLSDVSLSSVSNDDILQYNSSTGKWENETPSDVDINLNVTSVSTTYNILITDDLILCDASSGSFTVTLPTAIGNSGKQIFIKKIDSTNGIVTVDTVLSQTIDSESEQRLTSEGDCMDLASNDENWFIT